jgi:dienelactone hydrolase
VNARPVEIPLEDAVIAADLAVPEDGGAVVMFAHGSGSSRHSPRNRQVAERLRREGLGTLLLDLLTEDEELVDARTGELRFDIGLLADRLVGAVSWMDGRPELRDRAVGYFGASTGAAAALVAAARQGDRVGAIVSRGGRPDLAADALSSVIAPTLLIVGGHDEPVIEFNRQALGQLACAKRLEIVPGAGHLFEEPGGLERVTALAADWFAEHFKSGRSQ